MDVREDNIRKLIAGCYAPETPETAFDRDLFRTALGEFRAGAKARGVAGNRFGLWPLLLMAAAALLGVLYLDGRLTGTAPQESRTESIARIAHAAAATRSPASLLELARQAEALDARSLRFDLLGKVAAIHPNYLTDNEKADVLPSLGYEYLEYHFSSNPDAPTFNWQARAQWLRGEDLSEAREMENVYKCQVATPECRLLDDQAADLARESGLEGQPHSIAVFPHYVIVIQESDSTMTHSLLRYYDNLLGGVYDAYYGLFRDNGAGLPQHEPMRRHKVFLYRDAATWKSQRARLDASVLHGVYEKGDPDALLQGAVDQLIRFTLPAADAAADAHWTTLGLRRWFSGYEHYESSGDYVFGEPQPRLRALAADLLRDANLDVAAALRATPASEWELRSTTEPLAWAVVRALLADTQSHAAFLRILREVRAGRMTPAAVDDALAETLAAPAFQSALRESVEHQ